MSVSDAEQQSPGVSDEKKNEEEPMIVDEEEQYGDVMAQCRLCAEEVVHDVEDMQEHNIETHPTIRSKLPTSRRAAFNHTAQFFRTEGPAVTKITAERLSENVATGKRIHKKQKIADILPTVENFCLEFWNGEEKPATFVVKKYSRK